MTSRGIEIIFGCAWLMTATSFALFELHQPVKTQIQRLAQVQNESATASASYMTCMEHYGVDHSGPNVAGRDVQRDADLACEKPLSQFIYAAFTELKEYSRSALDKPSTDKLWADATKAASHLRDGAHDLIGLTIRLNNSRGSV